MSAGYGAHWRAAFTLYLDRRILLIAAMGLASGLPLALTTATLSYWLARLGVSKTAIGLFALVGLAYGWKFLWAPAIDRLPLPVLSRRLGRRRGWAVAIQLPLMAGICALGFTDPATQLTLTALVAAGVAFLSASQDIVIDAMRIELLEEDEQGAGAAATQAGYRIGLLISGAGAIWLGDYMGWPGVFAVMACFILVGMAAVLLAPEPDGGAETIARPLSVSEIRHAWVAPVLEFLRRPGALWILAFVLLYKFGDAVGGVMANPFFVELGFSGEDIALVSKLYGLIATFIGIFVGGALVRRAGIFRALLFGGIAQAATNLLLAWLALRGPDVAALALAVGVDNFAGGLGSAAFVAYLSRLCAREFTGTQYALLSSFMAQGRTMLSSGGGWLADQTDWFTFFALTALLAVPGLLLLWVIARRSRHT